MMSMKNLLLFGLSFFTTFVVLSQDFEIRRLQLHLPQEEPIVKHIVLDKQEMLWFTANSSLFRFDGFRSLDVLANISDTEKQLAPNKLLATTSNEIVFTSHHEVYKLDLPNWKLINISPPFFSKNKNYVCNQITELNDGSWLLLYESGEIIRYFNGKWTLLFPIEKSSNSFEPLLSVNCLLETDDYLWVGTSAGYLLQISKIDWSLSKQIKLFDANVYS